MTDAVAGWSEAGLTVRAVRGVKMRSTPELMSEVAAALQFPYYFGENWAALDECLADMEWLLPSRAIVLVVREAEQVLVEESAEQLEAFVAALRNASEEYGEPIALGEALDHPAIPFHVVLQVAGGRRGWRRDALDVGWRASQVLGRGVRGRSRSRRVVVDYDSPAFDYDGSAERNICSVAPSGGDAFA